MRKMVCDICGYVYEPEQGDDSSNVAPGTNWDDLPDNWTCPVCGAEKESFSEMEE